MQFGATILDAEGLRLTPDEKALFRAVKPFGFILFARNIDTPDQVRALCDEMRHAAGHNAVITVDQEGGRVQRLRAPHWREWTPPLDLVARAGPKAARAMELRFRLIADELHALGIDSNCAPTLDVACPETHAFLRNRCYGEDPDQVTQIGRAAARGMLQGGVLPVMKHMPGHGRSVSDTHFDLPQVAASLDDLRAVDFAPFRALRDMPMAMTAHLIFSELDPEPATCSAQIMQVIREDIGFDNLIMTDDLSMKALKGSHTDSARAALAAGCDVVLYCNQTLADRDAVAQTAGTLTDAAQTRAERAMAARQTPTDIDIHALERELKALTGEAWDG